MKRALTGILLVFLCAPVFAQTIFRAPASNIRDWLVANGYSRNVAHGLRQYFVSISPLETGTLNDHINRVLTDQGYEGTVNDKLNQFFFDETGIVNRWQAEVVFWANAGSSFGGGGGGGDASCWEEDGNGDLMPKTTCPSGGDWEEDGNSDLIPTTTAGNDTYWEEDGNGDKQPKA